MTYCETIIYDLICLDPKNETVVLIYVITIRNLLNSIIVGQEV